MTTALRSSTRSTSCNDSTTSPRRTIRDDVDAVVSAVVGSVRAVVPVTGPNGETMPVDLTQLNAALDSVSANSARLVAYGRKHCQLSGSQQ